MAEGGRRWWLALCLLAGVSCSVAQPAVAPAGAVAPRPAETQADAPPPRPRIGLVLSGGGARGLAHVGVLKVLEELQVPIDVIAGTSMGAIVGGLYASGMDAKALEQALREVQWTDLFAQRVQRQDLSQRRKEEDFDISPLVELGLRQGELLAPSSAVSSRGLESLLRRYTLAVRALPRFDALPIPFRAVATDMETGQPVVLGQGDLALALRSSMSVPGVFAPTQWEGRILGDGGLVDNLPVDVVRAMGADLVIAVNIGTTLAGRDTLNTPVGLTAQMINILTEQNVQRSLALLRPADLLIEPALGALTASDFDQALRFFALGEAGARGRSDRLAALSLSAAQFAEHRRQRRAVTAALPAGTPLDAVRITGSALTNPQRLSAMLESRPGQDFDADRAGRDAQRLAAGGDYSRTDYHLERDALSQRDSLVFDLEDKPWGPNYLRAGLDMGTDFSGRSAFNLKLSHNRHWLTPSGTEWRNRLQIGQTPQVFTELYHPLGWTASRANDWFVAGYAGAERRRLGVYDAGSGEELAAFRRNQLAAGLDLGQPWGAIGELRLGWSRLVLDAKALLVDARLATASPRLHLIEDAVRAKVVVDQLDFAVFPQSGYRAAVEAWAGRRSGDLAGSFYRLEGDAKWVKSLGPHTVELYALAQTAEQGGASTLSRYSLGGFQRLSGYQDGQLTGNHVLLGRLGWYQRLSPTPGVTRGFFVGATAEAGNAWAQRSGIRLGDLRTGFSVFLGADTGIGPLYFGITHAPQGSTGLALFIGRP